MNGLTQHQWWWRTVIFVLIAGWRIYQTGRRPSLVSALISIAFVGTAANLVLEALAHDASGDPGGHAYPLAAAQAVVLLVAWCATCGYYAIADATARGRHLSTALIGYACLIGVALIITSAAVPAGTRLSDYAAPGVARYYTVVFAFFPLAQALAGYLAARTAARATGSLRAAMGLAATALWALALAGVMFLADVWIQHGGDRVPHAYAVTERALYLGGDVLWILSFAAVAAAHRSRQLGALWRALGENRQMRTLLHALEAVSPPNLAYPRTGRTPLLMRPHAALLRTRVEARDRLVTVSARLGEHLGEDARQQPDAVAAALAGLRADRAEPVAAQRVAPVALLTTDPGDGTDPLTALARSYALITTTTR